LPLSPAAAGAAACSALGSQRGGGGEGEARVSPAALAWGRSEGREGGRRNDVLVAISFPL